MGLIRQSVHPMDSPKDEYGNESMTQNHRIADQFHAADSPRGADVAVAAGTRRTSKDDANDKAVYHPQPDLDRSGELSSATPTQPTTWVQNKSERRLVFADENGGALADITYSSRTHYSKQAGSSSMPGAGRACCIIS